ncbi:MAG: signal peptidase I [Bacteroidota bacterium]
MNSEIITNKPRNPILAFFLAFFFPGFGQVYNGQIKKGLLFFLISFTLPILLGFTKLGVFFIGLFTILIIDFTFKIYVIYDAVKNAKKQKTYTLKSYNTWHHYLLIIVGISAVTWFYDYNTAIGVKSYQIPTTSNEPTIKLGDKVVADLKAFNNSNPNYGDIVIFQKKDSANPWIYRIVALPNDKLEIQNNFLVINGKKCKTTFIKETKSQGFAVNEYEEELPNGHKHRIHSLKKPLDVQLNSINKITIPPNSYFLIGDNRDNAMDSRFIGVIKREEILAKVIFGLWGNTSDRMNINFSDK